MTRFRLLLCALCGAMALSQPAYAGFGMKDGDGIEHVADLPDIAITRVNGRPAQLGYFYSTRSLLGMPFFVDHDVRPFVLYAQKDGQTDYTPLSNADIQVIARAIGRDPVAGYAFSPWKYIWGLYLFEALVALVALKTLLNGRPRKVSGTVMFLHSPDADYAQQALRAAVAHVHRTAAARDGADDEHSIKTFDERIEERLAELAREEQQQDKPGADLKHRQIRKFA